MSSDSYDLIVIGSGPAGEKGAAQAAYFGKKVAIVEKEKILGGAAANTGTLPSKTLRETALYISGFRQRGLYGIDLNYKEEVTARDFLYREQHVSESEQCRVMVNLERHQIKRYTGHASFIDANTIKIQKGLGFETITGDKVLIATGSRPFRPDYLKSNPPGVYDSDTILSLNTIPKSMAVIGAGVIGSEYACTFAALGVNVSLIHGQDRLFAFADKEISDVLKKSMEAMNIDLCFSDRVESVTEDSGFTIKLDSGKVLSVETVMMATGRASNTDDLSLDKANVKTGNRGLIEVNDQFQTNVPNIYAAGDVIGFPALASTSMEQARVAMVHAFDLKYKTSVAKTLPYGIYTIPEISMAGETEESLQKKEIPYIVGHAEYNNNARGTIIGDDAGLLKLIFAKEDMKLLGVHIIGEQATELVHVGLVALNMEAKAELFIQTCFNYPTLSDLYKYATYDAMGKRGRE